MEKAGKKVYMSKIAVLVCVIALFCVSVENVCFGLLNEPWPNPTDAVWWAGAKVGEPNYWTDPCNWNQGQVPRDTNFVGYNFTVPPNGVSEPPVYAGDPNIVIIRSSEVAECNYLRLGGAGQTYVNLVVQGTLNVGGGPGTWRGLRINSWTSWGKNQVIIDGGTLNVNGDTDQSHMIVISGNVNVAGQIGLGAGANGNEYWSDQYYLEITNGTVRAGDFVMANVGSVSGKLGTDINGTGQLIINGDVTARLAGYKSNGWMTAYGGDPNYILHIALGTDGNTVVTAGLFNAAKAEVNSPADGTTVPWEDPNNKGHGPTLTWTAGVGATSHLVYFGSTFTDVNNANQSSPQYKGNQVLANKSYTVSLAAINLGQTYYWRIDENDSGVTVKGDVWQFSIMNYRVVDEFETYANNIGLMAVWGDGSTNGTGSSISLETTTVQGGLQSMKLNYSNATSPYISEANMLCSALPGCPNDWTAAGIRLLTISLHGIPSFAEPNVYVILKSNGGAQSGIVYYPDINELRQGSWEYFRFWAIDLAQFSSQGVDLHNVTGLVIGVGKKASPAAGGSGNIWVDTIRLQPPTCLQHSGNPDLNNDCVVDMGDLTILADNWLDTNTVVTASAPAVGPVLWYQFNEGSGYDIHDSSGNSYTGSLDLADWGGTGSGYDGSNCINLNNEAYVDVPIAAFNTSWGAECTFSFWFKDPGQDDNDNMLFQLNRGDGTNRGPQVWMGSTGFMEWACGYDPNTGYRDFLWFGQNYNYSNPLHPLNKWVHYAFVKSAGAGYMRIYQNGSIVAESTNVIGDKLDAADANTYFTIGAWQWSNNSGSGIGGYCKGLMDDFRIYNYALTPGQVLSLAVAGGTATSPMTQPLVTPADIVSDEIVNFNDFAVLADKWHQAALFP